MISRTRIWVWSSGSILIFVFVWQQLQSVRLGFELESTRHIVEAQRNRNAYLRLEMERLLSPTWLSLAAQQQLHMKPPAPESLIILEPRSGSPASSTFVAATMSRLFTRD